MARAPILHTLALHTAATLLTAAVLRVLRPRLDGRWFRVPAGEGALHRALRVRAYHRLLRSGWERVVTCRVRLWSGAAVTGRS